MHCATTKWNILASKSFYFLSFQDSAIVLSGVRLDQFQYTFLHILSIGNIFFLPGVSLSSNYIPLVNEVNLQIIYYSGLGDGNGPFARGGELKWFLAVLRG